jgi:hypothetical protein
MVQDKPLEMALFRYRIIAPLLDPALEPAERTRVRREILAKTYTDPVTGKPRKIAERTLRRYLELYRKGGFEALKPKRRSDASLPRSIPPEVLDKAVALKEELPERSVRQIIEMLVLDDTSGYKRVTLNRLLCPGTCGGWEKPDKP